jgi:hypothetical protein
MENPVQRDGHSPVKRSVKERAREELRRYAVVAAYLWICLTALLLYKKALLREEGVSFLVHGIAAVKALILGKFILIGEALHVGSRSSPSTLLRAIVRKTLVLLITLIVLNLVEELLVGWFHGHSAAQTLAEFFGPRSLETLVKCVVMLLVMIPLVAGEEISAALGPGVLKRMLFSAPSQTAAERKDDSAAHAP